MLKGREHFGLFASPSAALPRIVGKIATQDTTDRELENLLAAFIPSSTTSLTQVYRNTLDNAICIDSLIRQDMPFQAMTAALSGVRIAATLAYSAKGEAHELMTEAMHAFIRLGDAQFSDLLSYPTDTERWFKWIGGAAEQIITYPVTCLRIIEFLGLASLYARHIGQPTEAEKYAHLCDAVVSSQEGCFHPISDRYAASLIPPLIALYASGRASTATRMLRGVTKWVCDQYERSDFGLAGPHSTPEEEVRQFLGYAFDWIDLQPRRDSLIAVALIDFAYVFLPEQYELILNEFLAVNTLPATLHALDAPQSLTVQGEGIQSLFNIKYPPAPQNELLAHHRLQPTPRTPECVGGPVALLALACLARDRLFSDCYPRIKSTLNDKT
jgi:hypothetical protein